MHQKFHSHYVWFMFVKALSYPISMILNSILSHLAYPHRFQALLKANINTNPILMLPKLNITLFSKNDLNEFFLAILGRNMFFLLTLRREIDSLEGRNYLDM